MLRHSLRAFVGALLLAAPAAALDVRVKDLRAPRNTVGVSVEVIDGLPDRFRRLVDDHGVVHLRLQAELWESRPVWDRLVYPAVVQVFRIMRAVSGRDLNVTDSAGTVSMHTSMPNPLAVLMELGNGDRVNATHKYYVRVVATLGTLADHEIDDVGDAVFGRASDANALGSFGRTVFRKLIDIGDYLQSVSAETKGKATPGREILRP
jgi:hypothetical protein